MRLSYRFMIHVISSFSQPHSPHSPSLIIRWSAQKKPETSCTPPPFIQFTFCTCSDANSSWLLCEMILHWNTGFKYEICKLSCTGYLWSITNTAGNTNTLSFVDCHAIPSLENIRINPIPIVCRHSYSLLSPTTRKHSPERTET